MIIMYKQKWTQPVHPNLIFRNWYQAEAANGLKLPSLGWVTKHSKCGCDNYAGYLHKEFHVREPLSCKNRLVVGYSPSEERQKG